MRSASAEPYTLPVIPSLETLKLGQVIFLDPSVIVDFIFNTSKAIPIYRGTARDCV